MYPLNDLLMTIVDQKKDWNSFYLILIRGYYYFLKRNRNSLQQDVIEKHIQSFCNNNPEFYKENYSLKVDKDIVEDIESMEKFLDEKEIVKPTLLSAGTQVLETFLDGVNRHNNSELSLLNCGSGIEATDNDSLFLAISKIIYGSSHYYINLRLFLCFYYRSISLLSRKHPFYTNDNVDMMIIEILERLYDGNIPNRLLHPRCRWERSNYRTCSIQKNLIPSLTLTLTLTLTLIFKPRTENDVRFFFTDRSKKYTVQNSPLSLVIASITVTSNISKQYLYRYNKNQSSSSLSIQF